VDKKARARAMERGMFVSTQTSFKRSWKGIERYYHPTTAKSKKGKAQAALIASLTPEELAAAQRRALLAQYGYVDEDEGRASTLDEAGGARGETLRRREEDKEAQERRSLIDAAIKAETKRRKKSKRANERGESS